MHHRNWDVYLSGEIHSDWRQRIIAGAQERDLPVRFSSPVTDHDASDHCGVRILGEEPNSWEDSGRFRVEVIRANHVFYSRTNMIDHAMTDAASAAYCRAGDLTVCATCVASQPTMMNAPSISSQL